MTTPDLSRHPDRSIDDKFERVVAERDDLAGALVETERELEEAMSILAKVGDAISPTGERPEEALSTLADDVRTVVDQRDAARVEIEHLREQLGQAVDVLMANGWKREADRLDEAEQAALAVLRDPQTGPMLDRAVGITGNACCGGNGVEASCDKCRTGEGDEHGFAFALGARGLAEHPWQEYNAHGYLCHYPGCQKTPDEHEETK